MVEGVRLALITASGDSLLHQVVFAFKVEAGGSLISDWEVNPRLMGNTVVPFEPVDCGGKEVLLADAFLLWSELHLQEEMGIPRVPEDINLDIGLVLLFVARKDDAVAVVHERACEMLAGAFLKLEANEDA